MPKQSRSALIAFGSLAALAIAVARAPESNDLIPSRRELASVSRARTVRHTDKLHGPVTVAVDLDGAAPAAAGDVFTLRGTVSSTEPLDQIEFKWSVPPGLEVVGGETSGTIIHLDANGTATVELTLKARDASNNQVHLLAHAAANGVRFAESAQYNTTRQAEFAASRARLVKSSESRAEPELKVYH